MTRTDRTISSVGGGRPDWDTTPTPINSGDTITDDGWLYCYGYSTAVSAGDSPSVVKVNNHEVLRISCAGASSENNKSAIGRAGIPVPVSKGDKITTFGHITSMLFYPCK